MENETLVNAGAGVTVEPQKPASTVVHNQIMGLMGVPEELTAETKAGEK